MHHRMALRIVIVAFALSVIAPAILVANGVGDVDLLLVVFVPSVAVGVTSGFLARRGVPAENAP